MFCTNLQNALKEYLKSFANQKRPKVIAISSAPELVQEI